MLTLAAEQTGGSNPTSFLLTLALIFGAMYLLLIRPQRTRMRALARVQATLAPGSEVVLTSGIYGTVVNVEQDSLHLEIAPGVHVKVVRGAVARVLDDGPDADASGLAADADDEAPTG